MWEAPMDVAESRLRDVGLNRDGEIFEGREKGVEK
jgi:hypothetical protein